MSGGLMQLVAYGAQDVYLTGDPQITFWKGVYRRHTHFAIESIENTFSGSVAANATTSCTISRNADLLSAIHLEVVVTAANAASDVGYGVVSSAEVQIGGQTIDKQYGNWMQVWDDLTLPEEKVTGYNKMIGASLTADSHTLYIPLKFWFCRHPGSAIPLVALQFHEVRVKVTFGNPMDDNGTPAAVTIDSAKLYADYVYLDEEERQRFSQSAQEYLIEQVQHKSSSTSTGANNISIPFNHPVKELIWATRDTTSGDLKASGTGTNKITFNGQDRAAARSSDYFNLVQPYQHHTRIPGDGVHVYSFGLRPEEHQPSGTVNFSRIDNASMTIVGGGTGTANIYAVNYNVLRVQSGLGGLAYSN